MVLVAGTVLLKWSFVAPYVADRIATWTVAQLFPYASRDLLTAIFFKSRPCNLHPVPVLRAQQPDDWTLIAESCTLSNGISAPITEP